MRATMRIWLPLLLLLSCVVYGAQVGDRISNTAHFDYRIGDLDKNLSSNEVNLTVAQTPARIEWLAYDPGSTVTERLEPTRYERGSGSTPMPPAQLPGGGTITPPATIGVVGASGYRERDLGIIRLTDPDQDSNASSPQTVDVNVSNPRTGEIEQLHLRETGPNTGVFVGYIQLDPHDTPDPDGRLVVSSGDRIVADYLDNGTLRRIAAEADISASSGALVVNKQQSKEKAAVGEYLKYTVTVRNRSGVQQNDVVVIDRLPAGIRYQKGSFRIGAEQVEPELSADGRELRYSLPRPMADGSQLQLSYVVLVTAGVIDRRATNRAWAFSPQSGRSNTAAVTLRVTRDLYRDKGYILGQVIDAEAYAPEHNDTLGGYGVAGVRLYMEDGRYAVTDKEGKFHFLDVSNGTHVVQIDEDSIQGRYTVAMCEPGTRFAGNPRSQFVTMDHGELRRVDFCLKRRKGIGGHAVMRLELKKRSRRRLRVVFHISTDMPLTRPEIYLTLPAGIRYVPGSVEGAGKPETVDGVLIVPLHGSSRASVELELRDRVAAENPIRAVLYYDTPLSEDRHSGVAELTFSGGGSGAYISKILRSHQKIAISEPATKKGSDGGGDFNWSKPTRQKWMPEFTPKKIDTLGKTPQIVWPPKNWIPWIPATKIAVLLPKGGRLELKLNGKKVDSANYEDLFRSSDRSMELIYYKGVDLKPGSNIIQAVIRRADGKKIATLTRKIFVENGPAYRIRFLPEYSWLVADGVHRPVVAVRFLGSSGHPLRSGLIGGFETGGGVEPAETLNGTGKFTIDSEGIAYIRLKPTRYTGKATLKFRLADNRNQKVEFYLKPGAHRPWIVVGYAEGTVGYRSLHGHKAVHDAAGGKHHLYHDGRVAFFAKGPVADGWLMTLAYDTGRTRHERRLFDAVDPDDYYLLYQDAATGGSEAPSRRKLYLKLQKERYSILFGDFRTDLGEGRLTNYDNAFTGLQARYDGTKLRVSAFGAASDKLHFREDLRGDGTRGSYRLAHTPIVEGSEMVTIEVRDRHHPERVLSRKSLTRYEDYDIDYDRGTLYFDQPIDSNDEAFNPQFIVVRYEVDGGRGSHYTYGGRISYGDENGSYRVGATYVNEDTGGGHDQLFGFDGRFRITQKSTLELEWAGSRTTRDSERSLAYAKRIGLEYGDRNLTLRGWYRQQDDGFGLGELSDSLGGTRQIGLSMRRRLDAHLSLNARLFENRNTQSDGERDRERVAELNLRYRDENLSAELGYRYAHNDDSGVIHQITAALSRSYLDGRLKMSLGHDQTIGGGKDEEYPTRTWFGADYAYDENLSVFGRVERNWKGGAKQWLARAGMSYHPLEDTEIKLSRLYESDRDEARIYDTLGLKRSWRFAEHWSLDLDYEKGVSEQGEGDDFDAASVDLRYEDRRYSGRLGLGFRVGDGRKWNLDSGFYIRKSEKLGLAFGLDWHQSWEHGDTHRNVDGKFAFVYRPERTRWIVLDRFDIKDELDKTGAQKSRTTKFVNNLHLNWHPASRWHIGFQYGLKYVVDTIDGIRYDSWTDLLGLHADYDIDARWSVGIRASMLHSYTGHNLDYSGGLYLTRTVAKNTRITLGYNLAGFDDEDFSRSDYHFQGPYVKVQIKFDQLSLKGLLSGGL